MRTVMFLIAMMLVSGGAKAAEPESAFKECLSSSAARHKSDIAQIRKASQDETIAPMVLAASCGDVRDAFMQACIKSEREDACTAKVKALSLQAVIDSQ